MITIAIEKGQLKRLKKAIEGTSRKMDREIAIAINQTRTPARNTVSKQVREELSISAKNLNPLLQIGSKASPSRLTSSVSLKKSKRPNLADFTGTRQLKKGGLSYKVSKSRGRSRAPHAFQVGRFSGKAYQRIGKPRGPIKQLSGPSPWGVYRKNKMIRQGVKTIAEILRSKTERRIRDAIRKKQGKFK